MYEDILAPTDGSEGVQRSIDHGIDLAALTDATVHALFVVEPADATAVPEAEWLTVEEALEEAGERAVADIADRARERDVAVTTEVRRGAPHAGIVV